MIQDDPIFLVSDQEMSSNELVLQDENSTQNVEIEETRASDTDEGAFQQCVVNEGMIVSSDNSVCAKVSTDSVIYADD